MGMPWSMRIINGRRLKTVGDYRNLTSSSVTATEFQERERETFITELGEGRKTTLKGGLKLRKAKATTLGIVLHARSCAMGGGDVVGEVKGVEEVGV